MNSASSKSSTLSALVVAMRPVHWVKNLLLAVPLLAGQQFSDGDRWISLLLGMIAFSLVASSVYLMNDLHDVAADRQHPIKRLRPFASGQLSFRVGLIAAIALIIGGFAVAGSLLSTRFVLILAGYLAMTTVYSIWAKGRLAIDVLILASLYTLRLIAGGEATDMEPSFWLLAFSMFIFLSLAFVKRFAELAQIAASDREQAEGRGYRIEDMQLLGIVGPVSGYMAVLVFCLYINSDAVLKLYPKPQALWLVCPLLVYWVTRLWLLAHRNLLIDDPLVFTLRDRATYVIIVCVVIIGIIGTTR